MDDSRLPGADPRARARDLAPVLSSLPGIGPLRRHLRLEPARGRIWLGDKRMALVHLQSLAGLRRELIDSLGVESARGLLTRMGYASGAQDAETARRSVGVRGLERALLSGPRLHMLEGMVVVRPTRIVLDPESGRFCVGDFEWSESIEVECHRMHYGMAAEPVCWMEIGYASGYTSAFLGYPALFREIECRGMGAACCKVVGKPVEEWDKEALEDLRFFRSEDFVNVAMSRETSAPARTGGQSPQQVAADGEGEAPAEALIGLSSGFNAAAHLVKKVATTSATVLFLGETGVGKELFARNLHRISPRAGGPFLAVNCAAIPESLLESELFGVEKGAYTGAQASRAGRFERANGGTIFLDEVGTLTLSAQAKLLRVLQTREVERVGDSRTRSVDVRVVAATNEDLRQKAADGRFRSDLFYRLNVFPIHIPPLRERRDDLPLLTGHFLNKFSRMHGRRIRGLTERAVRALLDYAFPGNIRELENMIERAVILSSDDAPLDVFLLFSDVVSATPPPGVEVEPPGSTLALEGAVRDALGRGVVSLGAVEATMLRAAVEQTHGNVAAAARILGLTRRQLAYRLKHAT